MSICTRDDDIQDQDMTHGGYNVNDQFDQQSTSNRNTLSQECTILPWIKVKQEDIIDTVPIPDIHTDTPKPMHQ